MRARPASVVDALLAFSCDRDMPLVAMPRAEIQIVARFGISAHEGLDVHVLGVGQTARRKHIRGGQRAVTARLQLGAHEAALGAPARELAGRTIPLDALWGQADAVRLREQLHASRTVEDAASKLERALSHRALSRPKTPRSLVLTAARRLTHVPVRAVADELGVSERHLRRVFLEALGLSPKAFAKLSRFHRALQAAREKHRASWASIASAVGYYDQAHLIAEFRSIAGTTPQLLVRELGDGPVVG